MACSSHLHSLGLCMALKDSESQSEIREKISYHSRNKKMIYTEQRTVIIIYLYLYCLLRGEEYNI